MFDRVVLELLNLKNTIYETFLLENCPFQQNKIFQLCTFFSFFPKYHQNLILIVLFIEYILLHKNKVIYLPLVISVTVI